MPQQNNFHFLINVQSQTEIICASALQCVEQITQYKRMELPKLTLNYLKKKYEGYTPIQLQKIEKECSDLLQKWIDLDIILPFFEKEYCLNAMKDYTLWALKEKVQRYLKDNSGQNSDIDNQGKAIIVGGFDADILAQISLVRDNPKALHTINETILIRELGLNRAIVPNNLVVWAMDSKAGYICVGHSEFNREYKKLCIYKP